MVMLIFSHYFMKSINNKFYLKHLEASSIKIPPAMIAQAMQIFDEAKRYLNNKLKTDIWSLEQGTKYYLPLHKYGYHSFLDVNLNGLPDSYTENIELHSFQSMIPISFNFVDKSDTSKLDGAAAFNYETMVIRVNVIVDLAHYFYDTDHLFVREDILESTIEHELMHFIQFLMSNFSKNNKQVPFKQEEFSSKDIINNNPNNPNGLDSFIKTMAFNSYFKRARFFSRGLPSGYSYEDLKKTIKEIEIIPGNSPEEKVDNILRIIYLLDPVEFYPWINGLKEQALDKDDMRNSYDFNRFIKRNLRFSFLEKYAPKLWAKAIKEFYKIMQPYMDFEDYEREKERYRDKFVAMNEQKMAAKLPEIYKKLNGKRIKVKDADSDLKQFFLRSDPNLGITQKYNYNSDVEVKKINDTTYQIIIYDLEGNIYDIVELQTTK